MTKRELLSRMDSAEITEWIVYFKVLSQEQAAQSGTM